MIAPPTTADANTDADLPVGNALATTSGVSFAAEFQASNWKSATEIL